MKFENRVGGVSRRAANRQCEKTDARTDTRALTQSYTDVLKVDGCAAATYYRIDERPILFLFLQ